jgi:hypothetical protein
LSVVLNSPDSEASEVQALLNKVKQKKSDKQPEKQVDAQKETSISDQTD